MIIGISDTSYGPKEMMIDLVKQCHSRGIKIILDILLHGVLDKEIIKRAARRRSKSSVLHVWLLQTLPDRFAADVNDWDCALFFQLRRQRHVLDF
jgi:glycosidase